MQTDNGLKIITRLAMLTPGMYIFRYASESDSKQPAPVTLQAAPMGRGSVDFFPAEGIVKNTLYKLGDCIVVRVKSHEAGVLIAEYHAQVDAAAINPVSIRIDRIDTSANFINKKPEALSAHSSTTPSVEPHIKPFRPEDDQPVNLRLIGHVERRGDVMTTNGWLGDPYGKARIEGFAIEWEGRPQDVDLVYTCYSEAIGQMPAVFSGGFAGTRGKASPITSVSFALTGQGSVRYTLSGQVVFAGGSPLTIEAGKRLSGAAGNEPLIAINIIISKTQGEATVSRSPSLRNDAEFVHIFRKG